MNLQAIFTATVKNDCHSGFTEYIGISLIDYEIPVFVSLKSRETKPE